jgi:hypothetical protein
MGAFTDDEIRWGDYDRDTGIFGAKPVPIFRRWK